MAIFLNHLTAGLIRRAVLLSTIALFCYSGIAWAELFENEALKIEVEN